MDSNEIVGRGTEAFLANPDLSDIDDEKSDARSAVNIDVNHGVYGNRFEQHDPNARGSFMKVVRPPVLNPLAHSQGPMRRRRMDDARSEL